MKWPIILLILTAIGALWVIVTAKIDFKGDYRTANRDSAHMSPEAKSTTEAIIQFYAARTFSWRGIFAVHTWMAIKEKNAPRYTVYQLIGWRFFHGLPPLSVKTDIPDRNWFGHKPIILADIRGEAAEKLIPKITEAVEKYPYLQRYAYWPGPNSNTFIAYVGRQVPELRLTLPGNAIGKDFLPGSKILAKTPSGTGYQISLHGLLGITLALQEGLEITILGLVFGISPMTLTLKWPCIGDIRLRK